MRRVYQPPSTARHRVLVLACAIGLTLLVFLALPLTQIFSGDEEPEETVPARVNLAEPPPPPPPEEEPPPPAEESPDTLEDIPAEPEAEPEPIEFDQLELALEPTAGDAIEGDFTFGFNLGADTAAAFEAFEVSELDRAPRAISRPPPVYPYSMRRDRVTGSVSVIFVIDQSGEVREPRVEESTHREFERPALEAVRRWRFEPGGKDGKAVPTLVRTPIEFTLD